MPFRLLYADRYHLGDPLFLQGLARALGSRGAWPCLVLHGAGEEAERALEGEGIFADRVGGVLEVPDGRPAALVERAGREVNKRVVAVLTDAVVSSVGLMGGDRRLLVEEGGAVTAGRMDWVRDLARKQVVPVVAALVGGGPGLPLREVAEGDALVAVARALRDVEEEVEVIFFRRGAGDLGVPKEGEIKADKLLGKGVVDDEAALQRVAEEGFAIRLCRAVDLGGPMPPGGIVVRGKDGKK